MNSSMNWEEIKELAGDDVELQALIAQLEVKGISTAEFVDLVNDMITQFQDHVIPLMRNMYVSFIESFQNVYGELVKLGYISAPPPQPPIVKHGGRRRSRRELRDIRK